MIIINKNKLKLLILFLGVLTSSCGQMYPSLGAEPSQREILSDNEEETSQPKDSDGEIALEDEQDDVNSEPNPTGVTEYEEINLTKIPTKVYLFQFEGPTQFSSTITNDEFKSLVKNVNKLWAAAGIEIDLINVDTIAVPLTSVDSNFANVSSGPEIQKALARAFPQSADKNAWQVGVISNFPGAWANAGGVYIKKAKSIIYAENKKSPEILAHEFGHSFGLAHVKNIDTNIMQVGGSGDPSSAVDLTEEQINFVRTNIKSGPVASYTPYITTGK